MSSADAQLAMQNGNSLQPIESQEFAQHFDLSQPEKAMSSYQKLMHEHTKQQFKTATDSSHRRSSEGKTGSLSSESSVDSTAS